jgi:hypothetical protein
MMIKRDKMALLSELNNVVDIEHIMNYVRCSFREAFMVRAVVEEAAALTSLALFVGMIAIWAQVFAAL